MAKVVFPDHLLGCTNGQRQVELLVDNYRELLLALEKQWPGIGEALAKSAVAIDGQIYQEPFRAGQCRQRNFFMARIEGG